MKLIHTKLVPGAREIETDQLEVGGRPRRVLEREANLYRSLHSEVANRVVDFLPCHPEHVTYLYYGLNYLTLSQ